jgi:hypothetical protein
LKYNRLVCVCPESFLNLFTSFSSVFLCVYTHTCICVYHLSFPPMNMECISYSFVVVLNAFCFFYITKTMFNTKREAHTLALSPISRGKSPVFIIVILVVDFLWLSFIMLRKISLISRFRIIFLLWRTDVYFQILFVHQLRWSHGFCFVFY